MEKSIQNSILLSSDLETVWDYLTNPSRTKMYMFNCEAISDWKVGSSLTWQAPVEGKMITFVKGKIAEINAPHLLKYTVFDPNSSMEDVDRNYLTVEYALTTQKDGTLLTVTQGDFSTVDEGERRYIESYNNGQGWNPILLKIKELLES